MDFWSRLLNPLASGGSRKDQAKDPAKRLHRFEKEYANLLSTWRTSSNLMRDSEAAETLEIRLQELTNILSDESRRPLPHPCIQYASLKQIYVPIGKIATTSFNEWIIKEAVLFFATLVETEEEAFVENPAFSASLTNLLVRITGVNSVRLGLDTESRVVELAFNITTKIRLDPDVLPAWFKSQDHHQQQQRTASNAHDTRDSREKFAGRTQRGDFPLFYILIDYIHHEGKVGDFARTGLLYIIEAASSSAALEQWIVESDLSTLMATGLGALYSQLSRKLVIDHPPHDLPPILALSDYEHPTSNYEIVSSCSPEFQSHLETFLSHLLFWQDVLNHCRSVEVKSTLLEHFQVIFLQQLLYPSLLESSDIDGGSSVAVLTYLRRILESLDHPDMINLILHYLLALPDHAPSRKPGPRTSISDARKRKSMDLASMVAEKSDSTATPLLFNLVDLIIACLKSRNQQTIHVTLQLVSVILKRHHRYAVTTLLRTDILPSRTFHRTVAAHEQEVEYLMALASSIGGYDSFDEVYDSALKDNMARIESHPCSLKLVAPKISVNNHKLPDIPNSLPGAPRDVREHTIRPDDVLLNTVLDHFETFFLNPVETNLSVTETIVDLAICGYMSLEGWMARNPSNYSFDEEDVEEETEPPAETEPLSEEEEQMKAMAKIRRRPRWIQSSVPRILDILKRLADQVQGYKETVPRFDELLQQRREAFRTADLMLNEPPLLNKGGSGQQGTPERASLDELSRSVSPTRPSALEGFAQRLLSELGTPSRSSSPRGRRDLAHRSSGSPAATPGPSSGAQGWASPKGMVIPPREFPINQGDSSRSGGIPRSYSPSSARDETNSSVDPRDTTAISQAAAFAAVDQSILARRVGTPDSQVKAIPLSFKKQPVPKIELKRASHSNLSGKVIPQSTDEAPSPDSAKEEAEKDVVKDEESQGEEAPEAEGADHEDDEEGTDSADTQDGSATPEQTTMVSVSHVLTNVIILQSFLFELASLLQVRAAMFDEVRFA